MLSIPPVSVRLLSFSSYTGFDVLYSQWRVLSSHLRPNPLLDTSYLTRRDRQIDDFSGTFTLAFHPWSDPKVPTKTLKRSLTSILKNAAELGLFLFSQPRDLQFRWFGSGSGAPKVLANLPALVMVADERGRKLAKPRTLVGVAAP